MKLPEKNHIFSLLDSYLPKQQIIVVGVSGGPDSMMLTYILQRYYEFREWDQSNICIAHFNHGQRKESKKELIYIQKNFDYNTIYWNTNIPKKGLGETKLRDLRHIFFEEVLKKSKSSSLFLGHNLTDRIETSLLNIVRGCSTEGFLSIKPNQKKKSHTIYRPLLDIPKTKIQKFCDTHSIKYFIDSTNDKPITSRNILRNKIIPSIQSLHEGGENNWYNSREVFYKDIGNPSKSHTMNRLHHTPDALWGATKRYSLPIKETTPEHFFELFKDVYYATQKTISSIQSFLDTGSGHMYVGGWYLFIIGNDIHCIDGKKDFWKKKYTQKKNITQHGKQEYNGYTFVAPKEWIGNTIRYPKEGDTYKNKRLLKYMLNKKIPVFMRNTTPVIASRKGIIAVLDNRK